MSEKAFLQKRVDTELKKSTQMQKVIVDKNAINEIERLEERRKKIDFVYANATNYTVAELNHVTGIAKCTIYHMLKRRDLTPKNYKPYKQGVSVTPAPVIKFERPPAVYSNKMFGE